MRKFFLFALPFFLCSNLLYAEKIKHVFGGDLEQYYELDDDGGSQDNGGRTYRLHFNQENQSARGTLLVFDGNGVDDGADNDFSGGSGIALFDTLPSFLTGVDLLGALASDPSPVAFNAANTNIQILQYSYSSNATGDDFVILEFRVINRNSFDLNDVKVALANDFDLFYKNEDKTAGFDAGRDMVYVQDNPREGFNYFTSAGAKLLLGNFDAYRISVVNGATGTMAYPNKDALRVLFFNGDASNIGDLTSGAENQDFEVALSSDLGALKSGQGKTLAFCVLASLGNSLPNSLDNLSQMSDICENYYSNTVDVCGNQIVNGTEACDDGNFVDGDGCSADCRSDETCGNGIADTSVGEICDDGNNVDGDGCSADCHSDETCGNGIADTSVGEICDDGNTLDGDGCRGDCSKFEHCGDGVLDVGETCDDGNNVDGDGCSAQCHSDETCGNGVKDSVTGEVCDDGNNVDGDGCSASCLSNETCGNGTVDLSKNELCDDGNTQNGDGCSAFCHSDETCGNGVVDTPIGEVCDDGNNDAGDGCSANCLSNESCSNNIVDEVNGETCDDGNLNNGDGCDSACQIEPATSSGPDGASDSAVCGNGKVETGEFCDDGNDIDGDGCTSCFLDISLVIEGGATSSTSGKGCQLSQQKQFSWISGLFLLLAALTLRWRRKDARMS